MWVQKSKTPGAFSCVERYTDELTGKTRTVSCTIYKNTAAERREAQKILDRRIAEMQTPTPSTITLKQIYDDYLVEIKREKKLSTYRKKVYTLGICVETIGENVLARKLTAHVVRKALLNSNKKESTLNEYLTLFKAMIRWAYKNELIESITFLDKLENFKVKAKKKEVTEKYMEKEELKDLIDKLEQPVWKEVITFAALTGMRIGEVIALEKRDIDLDNRLIHITKTFDPNNRVVTTTKTLSSMDTISIQDELVPVIQNINVMMSKQMLRYQYRSRLFISDTKGEHISYDALNKYFRENTERIVGKKLSLHSLRHTHASLMFEAGFSVEEVSRRLRNNSKIAREIYIHITERLKEKDAEKLKKVSFL